MTSIIEMSTCFILWTVNTLKEKRERLKEKIFIVKEPANIDCKF